MNSEALMSKSAESILEAVIKRDPHEGEFIQAVSEVVHSLEAVLSKNPQYVVGNSSFFFLLVSIVIDFP